MSEDQKPTQDREPTDEQIDRVAIALFLESARVTRLSVRLRAMARHFCGNAVTFWFRSEGELDTFCLHLANAVAKHVGSSDH